MNLGALWLIAGRKIGLFFLFGLFFSLFACVFFSTEYVIKRVSTHGTAIKLSLSLFITPHRIFLFRPFWLLKDIHMSSFKLINYSILKARIVKAGQPFLTRSTEDAIFISIERKT